MSNLVFSDLVYTAKYHITVVRPYNGKKCLGLNVQIGTLYDDQINFECLDVFKTRKNYLQRTSSINDVGNGMGQKSVKIADG